MSDLYSTEARHTGRARPTSPPRPSRPTAVRRSPAPTTTDAEFRSTAAELEVRYGLMVLPLDQYEPNTSPDTLAILVAGDQWTQPVLALRDRTGPGAQTAFNTARAILDGLRRSDPAALKVMVPTPRFGGRRAAVIARTTSTTGRK